MARPDLFRRAISALTLLNFDAFSWRALNVLRRKNPLFANRKDSLQR
ncbi:hypothetical protein [Burkholderia diffusa]|nr:hypothetical protein [Burkholderia diffusa]